MAQEDNVYNSDEVLWSDRPRRLEHRFLVLRKLGQGTYGKVQLALNKETNREVAIKTIKKAKIESDEDMLRIRREIHIMTSIRHPHIIHIYEVFETKQKIVIVMQYASGGELYDYLGCHKKLPEDEARRIFRQIASAVYYCHKNQICHRDLKLENILLDEDGNAQIADFGLSNIFDEKRRMNTFCGSSLYASPEIVKGTPYKGPEVDCWSLGVLLYTLIYGTMPFDGRNFKELVTQISEGRYEEPIIKSNASNLIRRLLTPDISRRANISDVCTDAWVNPSDKVSLLQVAEQMLSTADLQRDRLTLSRLCLGADAKIGYEKPNFSKTSSGNEKEETKKSQKFANHLESLNNLHKNQKLPTPEFYEQIINYDVCFVINKLITAVDTSISHTSQSKNEQKPITALKDKTVSSYNLRRKNGESTFPENINSAYVIPIFEVTSTVPKAKKLTKTNEKRKVQSQIESLHPKNEKENDCQKINSIAETNGVHTSLQNQIITISENLECSTVNGELQNKASVSINNLSTAVIHSNKMFNESKNTTKPFIKMNEMNNADYREACDLTNGFSRKSSPKTKRLHDTHSRGQKHSGPFARTKNHVLTLARILSSNYERLLRNSFKAPEKKKKPPGKVVIPANFDPNVPRDPVAIERERIVLFPTVSVSENKEKIEKKIEKIKKAALNMNLIRHCDPKNRLKIEKYLRSQAKKIQDLVYDEQRNLQMNLKKIKTYASFSNFSEFCRCSVPNVINMSETGNQNQSQFNFTGPIKINQEAEDFLEPNLSQNNEICPIEFTNNRYSVFSESKKRHHCCLKNLSNDPLGLRTLSRSKSEIKLSSEYLKNLSFDENKSQLKKLFLDAKLDSNIGKENLGITNSNLVSGPSKLLSRSASDSFLLQVEKYLCERNNGESCNNQSSKKHICHFQPNSEETLHKVCKEVRDKHWAFTKKTQSFKDSYYSPDSTTFYMSNDEPHPSSEIPIVKQEIFICRSSSTHNFVTSVKGKINDDIKCYINRLTSEPFLAKEKQANKIFEQTAEHTDDALESSTPTSNSKIRMQQKEKKILKRRNTLTCVVPSEDETNKSSKNAQGRNADVEAYLWNIYKEQEMLLLKQQSASQFSSSPSLNCLPQGVRVNESKSMSNINTEGSMIEKYSVRDFERQLSSVQTLAEIHPSTFRKCSQLSSQNERFSRGVHQIKSVSDEILTEEAKKDIIRKLFTEGKLSSLQDPSCQINDMKTPFFSQCLNDMEKHGEFRNTKDNSSLRRHPRKKIGLEKRKPESNNKSFLQLLSLKRIEEAEKELDRTQKTEIEDDPDSLLEALKTYGYKSVISQRFQGTDIASETANSLRYPHWFLARNLKADIPHLNYRYYDASFPSFTNFGESNNTTDVFFSGTASPYESQYAFNCGITSQPYEPLYGFNEGSSPSFHEIKHGINGGTVPNYCDVQYSYNWGTLNPYENLYAFSGESTPKLKETNYELNETQPSNVHEYPIFRQKQKKQSFYDWLSANFDDYQTTIKAEHDSLFNSDQYTGNSDVGKSHSQWSKEKKSYENSFLAEGTNDAEENNPNCFSSTGNEETLKFAAIHVESRKSSRPEKFRSQSTVGKLEVEPGESVQDRIWRKSFYSRFNNSALSRKERLNFLESDFSSESRAERASNMYSPSKHKSIKKNGFVISEESTKSHQWKRNLTTKLCGSSFEKLSPKNSLKTETSKSLLNDNLELKPNIFAQKMENSALNYKNEDSGPEH